MTFYRCVTKLSFVAMLLSVAAWANAAFGATIVFDASVEQTSETGDASKTAGLTIGANSDRLLVVTVSGENSTGQATSVTWGGASLTAGPQAAEGNNQSSIWYLFDPAAGADTVTVNISGSSGTGANRWLFGAASFYNVADTGSPLDTDAISGIAVPPTTVSLSLDAPAGALVVEAVSFNGGSDTTLGSPLSGQTLFLDAGNTSNNYDAFGSYDLAFSSDPTTQEWSYLAGAGGGKRYALVAASFSAVPEPHAFLLIVLGLIGSIGIMRRRVCRTT